MKLQEKKYGMSYELLSVFSYLLIFPHYGNIK